jgi:hypothetical protein
VAIWLAAADAASCNILLNSISSGKRKSSSVGHRILLHASRDETAIWIHTIVTEDCWSEIQPVLCDCSSFSLSILCLICSGSRLLSSDNLRPSPFFLPDR